MPSVAPPRVARVAVAGATGYTGQELLRLLARHPAVAHHARRRRRATGASGAASCRRSARLWDGDDHAARSADDAGAEADLVFLALPDAAAAELAPALVDAGVRVIDLSGAFRLREADAARALVSRNAPRCRTASPTGSPSASAAPCARARLVANPGCYPTAALLALAPLVDAGLLVAGADIIVDAKSGVSGAGKTPSERTHFSEVPRQPVGVRRVQPPPRRRNRAGRRARRSRSRRTWCRSTAAFCRRSTCAWRRARPRKRSATCYEQAYAGATFVRLVGSALPEIKHVAHTNFCDIGWRVDPSGRVILVSVIDNLLKGASGQAVQNMNVMLGLDETDRAACFVPGPVRVRDLSALVLKFGGELLEDRARLATVVAAVRRMASRTARSSSSTAAARKSTRR